MINTENRYFADISLNPTELFSSSAAMAKAASYLYLYAYRFTVSGLVMYANSLSYNSVKLALQAWLLESTGIFRSSDDLAALYADAIECGFPRISDSCIASFDLLKRCGGSCYPDAAMSEQDLARVQGMLAFFSRVLNSKLS